MPRATRFMPATRFTRIRRFTRAGLLAVMTVSAATAWGQALPEDWATACPGAAAFEASHPERHYRAMQARDASRALTRPELVTELQRRVDADQKARRDYLNGRNARDLAMVQRVDDDNFGWMTDEVRQHGFPTAASVGEYGLHLLWLLVHHADNHPRVQRAFLNEFEARFQAGEFSPEDLSQFTDRVHVREGKPQLFGTQNDWARADLSGQRIGNLEEIERNRATLGLMSLADYGCKMHAARKRRD